ncbi:RNA polymerase sigma factor [Paludisphaera soli]|uniref:RNA polymerase sigma factor n=1 Tax=Paludisphaera soli TaxID=2712865 RepID=UPI0013EA38DF|nr:sigma-70 family RNA polymerase sigma factor [Paludisphaera soli]
MRTSGRRAVRDVERLLRDGVDPPGGDARLLHRYRAEGDESAFETLVDRHGPLVLALCRRYLRDPADVEDAFQATFLVLVRKGGSLRDGDALSSWLYGVARRVALRARSDLLKRRAREGEDVGLDRAVAAPQRPADDALETLDRELARLPEKYRAPLVLHLKGRTYDQAAAELGWPSGTLRSRMAKARALLHGRLTRLGIDAPACLALARVDLLPPAPPSLVATTVAAAGRFLGPASSLSSTAWPAAALAQGVLATMSPSPWKLLGFSIASVGLTAGALAVAGGGLNGPAPRDEPPPPQTPAAKADRLDALEAKLDRIAAMLAAPAAPASAPAADPSAAIRSAVDAKGLREIEAQLLNAYRLYETRLKLVERGLASREELEAVVQPVRVLFARLLDMKDERESALKLFQVAYKDFQRLRATAGERMAELDALNADEGSGPTEYQKIAAASRALQETRDQRDEARRDMLRLERELLPMQGHSAAVERLIAWTREHFPDAKLTIDDLR